MAGTYRRLLHHSFSVLPSLVSFVGAHSTVREKGLTQRSGENILLLYVFLALGNVKTLTFRTFLTTACSTQLIVPSDGFSSVFTPTFS